MLVALISIPINCFKIWRLKKLEVYLDEVAIIKNAVNNIVNELGVFHDNPGKLSKAKLIWLSEQSDLAVSKIKSIKLSRIRRWLPEQAEDLARWSVVNIHYINLIISDINKMVKEKS